MTALALAAGTALVVSAWFSLVAVFVLPRSRSWFQRAPSALQRLVASALQQLARPLRDYRRKDALLSATGPAVIVVQLGLFLLAFVVGFGLLVLPWSHGFALALNEAASGVFTVGLAHVVGPTNNVVIVLAAASGAVAIALQIGYLPVIYQSFARREALVALMESRAGVPAWGPEVLVRHQLISSTEALGRFYDDWELWSADLAESHGTHPVLVLFRSAVPGYSWLLSLLAVLDAAAMQLALCPTTSPVEARMCLRMGFSALRHLAVTMRWPVDIDPSPEDDIALTYGEFEVAVNLLVENGFPIERPAEEAWPHFKGWRVNYEAIAYRMADYLSAPHAPWSGPRRYLAPELVLPNRPPHRAPGGRVLRPEALRAGTLAAAPTRPRRRRARRRR